MLPSPILPLAQHARFGQNWLDVSIGSEFVCINHSMPMDAWLFQVFLTFSLVSDIVGEFGFHAQNTVNSSLKHAWFLHSPTIS